MSKQNVIMELSQVKKVFPLKRKTSLRALDDISFCIYEGEKFGVVGESGCGKSTLGRVILQLYPATAGSCVYYGRTVDEICPRYMEQEIQKLTTYQQKACELAEKAQPLEAEQQLQAGARVAGSLILSAKLPEVQALLMRAHKAAKASQLKEAESYREQAFAYRGRDMAQISGLSIDDNYLAQLDENYDQGIDLGRLTNHEMRLLRRDMQMIFQDPAASLDPRQSVGKAIEEIFVIHTGLSAPDRKEKVMELLERVGLKREHYYSYPHALSGGQKQRVGIARAIALDSKFIVLDESVSALDVSVQAQILILLNKLCEDNKRTYFFISHDLGVIKHFCDRILVMYLGHIVELSASKALFHNPLHPYTKTLLASVPRPKVHNADQPDFVLEGEVPSALNPPSGCAFHTRCAECADICQQEKPPLLEIEKGHLVACHAVAAAYAKS